MRQTVLAAPLPLEPAALLAAKAETRLHVTGLTCSSRSRIVATVLKKVETVEITELTEGEAKALVAAVSGVGCQSYPVPEDGS